MKEITIYLNDGTEINTKIRRMRVYAGTLTIWTLANDKTIYQMSEIESFYVE